MPPFIRDRFTWLAYLMLGYYAYFRRSPARLAVARAAEDGRGTTAGL